MRPRIAIVNSASQIGGAELSLLPVVRRLREEADVLALLPGDGPLHAELQALGIETQPLPLGLELARASRQYGTALGPRFAIAGAREQIAVLRVLRRIRPDVLYCNGFRAQLACSVPAAMLRIPTVWHLRDFLPDDIFGRTWSLLSRRAVAVIANSEATSRQPLLRHTRTVTIRNGIDLTRFTPRSGEPTGAPVIGMAAHLTPWKGHLRFVRTLAALRERVPGVSGRIAGGELYDTADHAVYAGELATAVQDLGVRDAVEVRHVQPEEMPAWLAGLSVLVHCPDRPEPFGRVLAEALAVGVPVVAAAGGGTEEVVGDAGIVLPLEDDAALLEAVAGLLEDPARRAALARAGVTRARELLDERRYVNHTAGIVLGVWRR